MLPCFRLSWLSTLSFHSLDCKRFSNFAQTGHIAPLVFLTCSCLFVSSPFFVWARNVDPHAFNDFDSVGFKDYLRLCTKLFLPVTQSLLCPSYPCFCRALPCWESSEAESWIFWQIPSFKEEAWKFLTAEIDGGALQSLGRKKLARPSVRISLAPAMIVLKKRTEFCRSDCV